MSSEWLRGGPFLELSFLLELQTNRNTVVWEIVKKLEKTKIEIVEKNLEQHISAFVAGYPFDESAHHSPAIHTLSLRANVGFRRSRRAVVSIDQIASNALMVNTYFYGSSEDAPEWDQIGIKENELVEFNDLLIDLYGHFEFKIGCIAYEENVLEFFSSDDTTPNECYSYELLTAKHLLMKTHLFVTTIWNEAYEKISNIPYPYERLDKNGLLIKTNGRYLNETAATND
ncbi:hypothetical protein [Metabacillus malikii]|uniref:Uncharacterized protein n=1 Tax=Metabacillus malikii TaxID=1504265 RepID=A0ABT9ZI77_9BACI|nr:hypothetical protein [Metabacillus malikii]MDQ0231988.1 hypothetical protein [Metabacillus malikii]